MKPFAARLGASLDGSEHRGSPSILLQTGPATKWGIFDRHFWGNFNRHWQRRKQL